LATFLPAEVTFSVVSVVGSLPFADPSGSVDMASVGGESGGGGWSASATIWAALRALSRLGPSSGAPSTNWCKNCSASIGVIGIPLVGLV
jgi:hypothetical protein